MARLTTHPRTLLPALVAALLSVSPAIAASGVLDKLYAELADPDNQDWRRVESDILREWSRSGSPAMDLLLKRGKEAIEAGDLDAAVEHLTALTDHAPEFAEGFSARASVYLMQGQVGPAVADLARALTLDARHFEALTGLAVIQEQLGRHEGAIAAYRASLAIHPHQDDVLEALKRLETKTTGTAL